MSKKQEIVEINPPVKQGDLIILMKARNNNSSFEGKLLTVTSPRKKASKTTFVAKCEESNKVINIYYSSPADEFILATRENIINYYKERNDLLLKEIKDNEEKIEFLSKYKDEDEYIADKISKMLKNPTKNNIYNAIKEIKSTI